MTTDHLSTNPSTKPPLEIVLFAMAGAVTLASALLAVLVSPWFLLLTAFVGVSEWLFVLVGVLWWTLGRHQ